MAPRPRSATWLAAKFEVSSRTIERDLSALQQAGVPIWAEPGRTGGYCIDPAHTLAPLGFTVDEALAVIIGLGMLSTSPFRAAAASALGKVLAVMEKRNLKETVRLAAQVHLLDDGQTTQGPPELATALRTGYVLKISYRDREGAETVREVEPLAYVGRGLDWYLNGWCQLRDGVRAFRGDRIVAAESTGERPPRRELHLEDLDIACGTLRSVSEPTNSP